MDENSFIEAMRLWHAQNYQKLKKASDDAGVSTGEYLLKVLDNTISEVLVVGDLTLNVTNATCACNGKRINFTRAEFDVIAVLMRNENRLVSTSALLEAADWKHDRESRGLSFLIYKLRKKTGISATQIVTVRGRGYRLHSSSSG